MNIFTKCNEIPRKKCVSCKVKPNRFIQADGWTNDDGKYEIVYPSKYSLQGYHDSSWLMRAMNTSTSTKIAKVSKVSGLAQLESSKKASSVTFIWIFKNKKSRFSDHKAQVKCHATRQSIILTFIILCGNSKVDKLMIQFLFSLENSSLRFMQIISQGNNLHEISKLIFFEN